MEIESDTPKSPKSLPSSKGQKKVFIKGSQNRGDKIVDENALKQRRVDEIMEAINKIIVPDNEGALEKDISEVLSECSLEDLKKFNIILPDLSICDARDLIQKRPMFDNILDNDN
ncbi:MAG: hypothetical protein AAF621_07565, partial [Pseudomonadota bacterium]